MMRMRTNMFRYIPYTYMYNVYIYTYARIQGIVLSININADIGSPRQFS